MERPGGEGKVCYRGKTFTVREDPVRIGEREALREVVERIGAAAVIAESGDGRVAMIRQFRWAVQAWLWELPAGKLEAGELPESAARRELSEEVGLQGGRWRWALDFYPSPGYTTETVHLYYARDLVQAQPHPDPDEELGVQWWDRATISAALHQGVIRNGIALVGLWWWLAQVTGQV